MRNFANLSNLAMFSMWDIVANLPSGSFPERFRSDTASGTLKTLDSLSFNREKRARVRTEYHHGD